MVVKKILTIAGSDCSGGAGIQADLKTITVLGGFGMSVITALTAQNTLGVQGVYPVPEEFVERQFDSVAMDIGIDAAKTGMLATSGILKVVVKKIKEYRIERLVVDPVMVAKGGVSLIESEAVKILTGELLPLACVVTPNIAEAEALSGIEISSVSDMKKSARIICALGVNNVIVKGGHLPGDAVDILYDGEDFHEFISERIDTLDTHGTGCTYSAAIATGLAEGRSLIEAVRMAKEYITTVIRFSLHIGGGRGPVNHFTPASREIERYRCIEELRNALQRLKDSRCGNIIPEVQSNLGYALPYARSRDDVGAIPGRIIRVGENVRTLGDPVFGASGHIASIILAAMRYDCDWRSAMNIRFSEDIIRICRELGYSIDTFDRSDETEEIKAKEGSSLEWGTGYVLSKRDTIPDIIFDRGDVGKEPMIRILGKTPYDVVEKALNISKRVKKQGE